MLVAAVVEQMELALKAMAELAAAEAQVRLELPEPPTWVGVGAVALPAVETTAARVS